MKIIVVARTHNSEEYVERFVKSYNWANKILLLDDYSDDLKYLMKVSSKKVTVEQKDIERIERNGASRAIQCIQLNYLINWAEHFNADWIIHDDIDCFPNQLLIDNGRRLIESSERDFIYMTRVYMYKDLGYASKMSLVHDTWQQSLWAWKANKGFKFSEDDPLAHTFTEPKENNIWRIKPPYALLHYPWTTDEVIQNKLDFYDRIYNRKIKHPLEYCGTIKNLKWWME